jgi:glycosyltransferase involved in cell wall biosynthesis
MSGEHLRICFVIPAATALYWPESQAVFGGSEVRAYLFAKQLAQLGHDVSVIVATAERQGLTWRDGVAVHGHEFRPTLAARAADRVRGLLNRAMQSRLCAPGLSALLRRIGADVYCAFGVAEFNAELAALVRSWRKHFVLFIGSDIDLAEGYHAGSTWRSPYGVAGDAGWRALNGADLIVCQTSSQRELLAARHRLAAVTIPNPADVDARATGGAPPQRTYGLWVGKTDAIKQPDVMIEVARRCSQIRFHLILNRTNDDSWQRATAAIPANVKLVSCVPYPAVQATFASAQFLLNTSIFEGFPNTFLQAGMEGIPVVSLQVDPAAMIARDNVGFCAHGSLDRMIEYVERLAGDPALRHDQGENLRRYVQRHHDPRRVTLQLVQAFAAVTAPSAGLARVTF